MQFELVVFTQVYEADRPKGGDEHVIATLDLNEVVELGQDGLARKVHYARQDIEFDNELCKEFVRNWELRERSQ